MPNLFSDLPVAILAWVPASTSGLTRTEIRAVLPVSTASRDSNSSSGSDSTLMQRMSAASAARSSASVLPTPENRILCGGMPAASARFNSPPGHHVGAGAELCQRAQHRLVGVGLHGVADQRLLAGEGLGEHPVVALQRRGRIAIERRADRIRQLDKIDRLGVQHAVAIVEVIHGRLSRGADRERRLSCGLSARPAAHRLP